MKNVLLFFPEPVQAPMVHWGKCPINRLIRALLPSTKTQFLWLISLSGTLTNLNLANMPCEISLMDLTQLQLGKTCHLLKQDILLTMSTTLAMWSVIANKMRSFVPEYLYIQRWVRTLSKLTLKISQSIKCGLGSVRNASMYVCMHAHVYMSEWCDLHC